VAVFPDGSYVVSGKFWDTINLEPTIDAGCSLVSSGQKDAWVARYSLYSGLEWGFRLGGVLDDHSPSVLVTPEDAVLVSGYFRGPVIFGEGGLNETEIPGSPIGENVFLARYTP
jgi:hypothetical protein